MNVQSNEPDLQETRAALMLSALGNEHRLRVFKLLVRAGPDGVSFGDIQQRLLIPPSTLSHHISALVNAELVVQRKDGRTIYNSANYRVMDHLLRYLYEECCVDSKE